MNYSILSGFYHVMEGNEIRYSFDYINIVFPFLYHVMSENKPIVVRVVRLMKRHQMRGQNSIIGQFLGTILSLNIEMSLRCKDTFASVL